MDVERLKDEANIDEVLDYAGVEVFPRGSNIYLHCPNPAHNDNHPTNCYYKRNWKSVYCTVCDENFNAIDILMNVKGLSFLDALNTLWEMEGKPEWALTRYDRKKKSAGVRKKNSDTFFLTKKEADVIGIVLPKKAWVPKTYSDEKLYLHSNMPRGLMEDEMEKQGYLYSRKERLSVSDFFDNEGFKSFVIHKCKLKNEQIEKSIKLDSELGIEDDYSDELATISSILAKM